MPPCCSLSLGMAASSVMSSVWCGEPGHRLPAPGPGPRPCRADSLLYQRGRNMEDYSALMHNRSLYKMNTPCAAAVMSVILT